ncbi:MAG: hypothetical protein F6K50_54710 [Moorea sp. SIO3I7]|nr:hypothetical protein [Moorena sp. SIO3I7]
MKKTYKCAKCGHEYKQESPPSKCEVRSDCKGAGFFIDLESYNSLEGRCNQLQYQISKTEEKANKNVCEEDLIPFTKKSRLKGRLKGKGRTSISKSKKDGLLQVVDDLANFKEQVKKLTETKNTVTSENTELKNKIDALKGDLSTKGDDLTKLTSENTELKNKIDALKGDLTTKLEGLTFTKETLNQKIISSKKN